jgi:type IV pilus assembly protein PilM
MSDPGGKSFLKKEITFRRRPKPKPAVEERSAMLDELERIKELVDGAPAFPPVTVEATRAVPVEEPPATVPAAESERVEAEPRPTPEKTSFWKQEISLGRRRPKRPKQPKKAAQPKKAEQKAEAPGAPDVARDPEPSPAPPPEPGPAPEPPPAAAAAEGEAKPEKTSFWKQEISLGRRPKAKDARVETKDARGARKARKAQKAKAEAGEEREPKRRAPRPRLSRPRRAKRGGHSPKRLVGLKIGASQIAAARVANNGAAELLQVARQQLEPGIVVGGELREPEKLVVALREFFRKHDLPKSGVRLGIANNRIGVRTFEITGIDDRKQLDNAVRFRAQETLPIPIEDAVLDYRILSESTGADGQRTRRVLLVVAYRDLVDRYAAACRQAGLGLVGIDLEAFALLRAMSAPRDDGSGAALVAVAVGHDRTTFAVSNGRACEFTRVLEWGGSSLDVALARALDVAPSETELLKNTLALDETTPPPGLTDKQLETAKAALRQQIQTFARQLVSSLQFYQNQPGSLSIGEIVLTGGTSHMPGLAAELESLIGVTVRVGDPLMRVRVGKKALGEEEQQIGSLAVAIGLGIED